MAKEFTGPYTRRQFLKRTSALAALGLTTSLTPDLIFADSKVDLKGVTIDYWNMIGVQNAQVRKISDNIVKAFEQRTGAKVNTTWDSYGSIIGPKYRTNFKGGIKPTVFDATSRWVGQLRDYLLPLDDFIAKEWNARARNNVSWLFPLLERQHTGFADAKVRKNLPFCLTMQAPYIMNRRHVEKAGLDFDKIYPLKDTDAYIHVCKEIQAKAGIKYPTAIYGKIWDYGDTQLNGWIRSLDIPTSDFITPDWKRSNGDTPAWIKGTQFYVDVYRKYHLSDPNTPQGTDEVAVDEFILGRKSIVHCDILNRGTLLDKIPDQMKDGSVVWGPHFPITGGHSGSQCFLSMNTFHIVKQEGPDAAIKERAAWEFIKEWFRDDNMLAIARSSGLCSRRDLWDQLKGAPDHSAEASIATIGTNPGVWTAHPRSVDFQYNLLAPYGQRALQGSPVEKEMKEYAAKVNAILQG